MGLTDQEIIAKLGPLAHQLHREASDLEVVLGAPRAKGDEIDRIVGVQLKRLEKLLAARTMALELDARAKAELARANGCAEVVLADAPDFVARVRELSGGGVAAVYDSVGKSTWEGTLDCLQPRGLMVSFGNASGAVPPVAPLELTRRGSLFLTRPTLFHYTAKASDLARGARELFEVVADGRIKVRIGREYALADAADAHRDLEARRTTGSLLLIP